MNYWELSLEKHEQYRWKLEVKSKVPLNDRNDLSTYYTPWVATPCLEIAKNPELAYKYTWKSNSVAVVSDWSAVLGLGNIWGIAWLPVMEGKSILFKEFWWVDAVPIVLSTQDPEEIIKVVEAIAPSFGGINLEDISSPNCFYVEEELKKRLNIPVFHDDQHGTAIVTLAWIINALKLTWKKKEDVKVLINWVWAAWIAIAKLLLNYGIKNIIMVDTFGAIYKWRENMNTVKDMIAEITNLELLRWWLAESIKWRDIFIWVSAPWVLTKDMVRSMNVDPMIFAMANPIPEIMPSDAKEAWAKIIATWRSDFPNQINNVLAFPWIFRWALDARIHKIEDKHKLAAAIALADYVKDIDYDHIIPNTLDKNVAMIVAEAVKSA